MTEGFFFQEVVDLYILSRARRIIGGHGGFVSLGKYWQGGTGPVLQRALNRTDVLVAMKWLMEDLGSMDVHINQ